MVFFTVLHPEGFGFLSSRFFEMRLYMRGIARTQDSAGPEECYERYKQWLPFAHRNRAFFEATARELGYGLYELNRNPDDRLF